MIILKEARLLLSLTASALLAHLLASPASASHFVDDIYKNSFATRRLASAVEHTLALQTENGCAGVFLAPTIAISAAHCHTTGELTSGIALHKGQPADATIGKTYELGRFTGYDYWIFQVIWKSGKHPSGLRVVPKIQIAPAQLKVGANSEADKLFTLGFPGDVSHGRLIYSHGFGKDDGNRGVIKNNISLINGNSGGGIFRRSDLMLVSIVSGGPHMLGQAGWNDSDWNDPAHWNWGPALWKVYRESRVLRSIFPNGLNRLIPGRYKGATTRVAVGQ